MTESISHPSPVDATYVEPSAEEPLEPGLKIGDLFRRNMTQPYVRQMLDSSGGVAAGGCGAPSLAAAAVGAGPARPRV